MADITSGDAYVDTVNGTDDAAHGTSSGAGACKSLGYIIASRIVELTGALTVHCVGGIDAYTGALAIANKSTAASKLTIQGNRWTSTSDGKFDTSKYYIQHNFDNHFMLLTEENIKFDGIQFSYENAGNGNTMIRSGEDVNAQIITFKNCIIRTTAGTNTTGIQIVNINATSTCNYQNCILYSIATAMSLGSGDAVQNISNCTLHGCTTVAINSTGNAPVVKNCIFDNNATDFVALQTWNAGSENNSTTSATELPDATGEHHSCADFNFTDLANHDFRLTATSGDPNIRNSGTTIAACSPDPLGTARPSETNYSRGAFEYVVAAGGSIVPLAMHHYKQQGTH